MADAASIKRKLGGLIPDFLRAKDGAPVSDYSIGLREGLIAGGTLFLILFAWMALRSSDTALKVQDALPYKSASIEEPKPEKIVDAGGQEGLNNPKNLNALPVAPLEGLTENHDGKILPTSRIQDDMTPFMAYKKPFQHVAGRPLVSIVIVDFGLSDILSKSVLDAMPTEISLVMSPYANEPTKWASSARAYGHEFWLSVPMQTKDFGSDDSGPNTLLINTSMEENQQRLFNVLGSAVGYAGMVSQKDHVFTTKDIDATPILKQIFGRGLAFAESNPDVAAFGLPMAMEFGYPYVQNNFWLDNDLRPSAIDQQLKDFELQATRNGKAIAFVHPYPVVISKVQEWLKDAEIRGLQVAPLSALVQ